MFRQSPSRIQRSKSFKVKKHGLQIFLLLAICLWLLYQVKHSHDKKKAFDENSMKLNAKLEDDRELTKLGRKDLHPRVEENISETESRGKEEVIEEDEENKPEEEEDKPEEEDEEEKPEEEEEEEENKPEEEEQEEEEEAEEEENKPEENERKRGDGDDEMDEHSQQRAEEEAEREEGFVDEEEKGAKEESEEGENEEKVQKSEKVVSSDDQDHDRNTQEAREENYKGDDASSAVLRETQVLTTEAESGNLGDVTNKELVENAEKSEFKLDETNATQKITYAQKNPDQDAVVDKEISVNLKTSKEKRNDGSQANSTVPKSDDLPVVSNSSMAEGVHTPSSHAESRTNTSSGSTQNQTHELVTARGSESELQAVDQAKNSNIIAVEDKSDSTSELSVTTVNADVARGEFSNTSNNAETVALKEQIGKSGEENNSMSLDANKIKYGAQSEKVETTDGAKESDNSKSFSSTNERDVVKILTNESTNHTVLNEEKDDARTDLGTLPGFENRGKNAEDAAVE